MKQDTLQDVQTFEAISALLDGELDSPGQARLITRCVQDRACAERWSLYGLTGDALRSAEVAALHHPAWAARLREQLASEPAYLRPAPQALATRRAGWRGAALAAAVAVLAFVLVPLAQQPQAPRVVLAGAPDLQAYLHAHHELAGGAAFEDEDATPPLRAAPTGDES